jgi:GGDEF-like domain/PucR C-terminal helix-turn-helix domain
MGRAVGIVVRRLRARQGEIEQAIFARVREVVSAPADDPEYLDGLRGAVAGAVEFCLAGLERGDGFPAEIPAQAVAQARRAARSGVSLDKVLRRYIVGNALICDYIMQECDSVEPRGRVSGRELLRAQAAQLDRLVIGVTREHVAELQRASRSHEHRLLERIRMLLAGEDGGEGAAPSTLDAELDYQLEGEHLGVIARGAGAVDAMHKLALSLDRRLLCVARGEELVWAWLGGRRALDVATLARIVPEAQPGSDVRLAVGEPARGFEGWRRTHRQAQAAMLVAARRPRALTRYGDVALLAAVLKDHALGSALVEIYLTPLERSRDGGQILRKTLRAYLAAERNASSAAVALGVARSTVERRVGAVEACLGRTLHPCPTELEVALQLDALTPSEDTGDTTGGSRFTLMDD